MQKDMHGKERRPRQRVDSVPWGKLTVNMSTSGQFNREWLEQMLVQSTIGLDLPETKLVGDR